MPPTDDEIRARRQQRFSLKVFPIDTPIGMQQRLNEAGFESGAEDGIVGPVTTAAIRRFQQYSQDYGDKGDPSIINSGPVDGIFGPITTKALDYYYNYFFQQEPSAQAILADAGDDVGAGDDPDAGAVADAGEGGDAGDSGSDGSGNA